MVDMLVTVNISSLPINQLSGIKLIDEISPKIPHKDPSVLNTLSGRNHDVPN